MSTLQEPYILVDFTGGLVDDLSVSDSLLPRNAVRKSTNVIFDRPRGSISQRYGTTKLGSNDVSTGNTILGLHNFRSSNANYNQLLAVADSTIYYLNGTSWASTSTGLTSGLKTRFLTYLDEVVALNGTDSPRSWSGTGAWLTNGGNLDVGNFPVGKFATILNTRILTAGVTSTPDTVYESSLEAGGAISWTSGNRNFRVYPNDGNGNITGLTSNGRLTLIFKERGMYRYDGNELQPVVRIGTPSNESIVTDDNGITYFFGMGANGVGFYRTQGAYPTKLSRAIPRYIEAISPSFYEHINGITDGTKIYWSVGSITINGISYTGAWYIWNIADETWEVRAYDDSFRVFSSYIDSSGNLTMVSGDIDGMVQTINSGTTDNGTPIFSECELGALSITTRGKVKVINEVVTYAEHYQGISLLLKVDDGIYFKFPSIKQSEQHFRDIPVFRGHRFYFKLSAVNSGTPFKFDGLEIPNITEEDY